MRTMLVVPIMLGLHLFAANLANDFACEVIRNPDRSELRATIEWVIMACYLP